MSLFWAPLIGIQPQQDPGITSGEMGWARETERDRERMNVAVKKVEERTRLIFLGLHRKPIKPLHGSCCSLRPQAPSQWGEGAEHFLERVLEAWAGK